MNRFHKWVVFLLLSALAIAISYQWLDRPISFFAHGELQRPLFVPLTWIPEWAEALAVVALLALGLHALAGLAMMQWQAVVLLCSVNLVVSSAIKNELKYVFGRTWPDTWINNNPSLIRDGAFGFNPFHGGAGWGSFPSGHTTVICAVMSVLWICYPRFRVLYAVVVAAVGVGLVGANYHFLSDVIAGGFLGISTGWIAVTMWEAGGCPRISPAVGAASPKPTAPRAG